MAKPNRYIVDFSDFVIEANDEDEALELAFRRITSDSHLPDVCDVSVCDVPHS